MIYVFFVQENVHLYKYLNERIIGRNAVDTFHVLNGQCFCLAPDHNVSIDKKTDSVSTRVYEIELLPLCILHIKFPVLHTCFKNVNCNMSD